MAFTSIDSNDIQAGKPITQALWTQVKDNFDALNVSLTSDSQQDISGTQTIADQTVNGTFVITDTGSTFTLPVVANNSGIILRFIQQGNGSSTIQGNGAENINGVNTYVLPKIYAGATMYCDGDEWHVLQETSEVYYKNAGTTAAPTIALDSDPDTGFYWSGTNEVSFVTGGTQALVITSNQRLRGVSAGSAEPTYSFISDPDTGMYNSDANEVSFVTAATQRWRINNSGNLISVNDSKLYTSDGTESLPSLSFINDLDTGFYLSNTGEISMSTGGSQRWRFDSTGDQVAVGSSRIYTSDGSASTPSYSFANDTNTGFYSSGADELSIATAGVQKWRINAAGNLISVNDSKFYSPDGTASLPGYSFVNDSDTGFTLNAANTIGFVTGGSTKFVLGTHLVNVSTASYIRGADGAAANPAYSFSNATNTGMWRSSGGNLVFTRSGVDIFGITTTAIFAGTDNSYTNGTDAFRWSNVFSNGINTDNVTVRHKKLTGTFGGSTGTNIDVSHGLTKDNIIGVQVASTDGGTGLRYVGSEDGGGSIDVVYISNTNIRVTHNNIALNSEAFEIIVTYEA